MKFSKLLVLPLVIVSFFSSVAGTVICLQQADINQQALLIEKKIIRDRYLVYGLTALGVAHELYQWTPYLTSLLGKSPVEAPKKEDKTMFQAFKEGVRSLFYTQEGWVSMIHCGLGIGGFVLISKVGEKFVHPDTLYWYVNAYAPYTRTLKMMQERLLTLQDPSLEINQSVVYKESLRTLYDRLARQGKLMCAYMTYKSRYLEGEDKTIARQAAISMLKSQNDWLARIGTQLDADNSNYEVIDQLLTAYGADIAFQLNYFSVVEGETPYDRAAAKRQMKAELPA